MTCPPAAPLEQHQAEIGQNRRHWDSKPLIQKIYARFYAEIVRRIDPSLAGRVVELGSGIGNLKAHCPGALCTDLFPNPWLDAVCDGYQLPFRDASVSHLILFDVFHHLQRPAAFLAQAARVVAVGGRVILFEPYLSLASWPAYGWFHHEPVAWSRAIELNPAPPPNHAYYAAQGNATRLFFRQKPNWLKPPWQLAEARAFAAFSYLLSGGLSGPALYPAGLLPAITALDGWLSCAPRLFGARCLVVLQKSAAAESQPPPLERV